MTTEYSEILETSFAVTTKGFYSKHKTKYMRVQVKTASGLMFAIGIAIFLIAFFSCERSGEFDQESAIEESQMMLQDEISIHAIRNTDYVMMLGRYGDYKPTPYRLLERKILDAIGPFGATDTSIITKISEGDYTLNMQGNNLLMDDGTLKIQKFIPSSTTTDIFTVDSGTPEFSIQSFRAGSANQINLLSKNGSSLKIGTDAQDSQGGIFMSGFITYVGLNTSNRINFSGSTAEFSGTPKFTNINESAAEYTLGLDASGNVVKYEPTEYSHGFIDYNDSSGSFSVPANTWTNVPNNGSGSFSNSTYAPDGVTDLLDVVTGFLDFSDLTLGSEILVRNDITITPSSNNTLLELRYVLGQGANEYFLPFWSERLDNGSGSPYKRVTTFPIYMGDLNTQGGVGKLQIRVSSNATAVNAGSYISVKKRN